MLQGVVQNPAMLAWCQEKKSLQTGTLLNNVKSSMAKSKMTDVVTMVVEEQQMAE